MDVDYGKIVTNALSALVAAVFVGAAAIVWNAATSIDKKIEKAKAGIKATQEVMSEEIAGVKGRAEINEKEIRGLREILAKVRLTEGKTTLDLDKILLPEKELDETTLKGLKKEESSRISDRIDTRQQEIFTLSR